MTLATPSHLDDPGSDDTEQRTASARADGLQRFVQAPVVRPDARPSQTGRSGPRNRVDPTIWEAMAVDPNLHVTPDSLEMQVRNLQRGHRRHTRPVVKVVCMFVIRLALFVKRLVPVPLGSERALNWLGPRFMRRWCSPETLEMVLRHLAIESNLINFVARNCGADDVEEVDLHPTRSDDLAEHVGRDGTRLNAVARHDANIFNLIIDLGESATADVHSPRPLDEIDFSMLEVPELDLEPGTRRWMQLDLESALHIVVATLAVLMDGKTAERAVNSFQLDESLLASIANITGDPTFRTWTPIKFGNWLGMTDDVGRDLHWHILVNEYAHTRLRWMGASVAA
jgi:hypothetical protein